MRQALITGGARGIGWGIASAMLEAGYAVTVTGLTPDEVKAVPAREHLKVVQLDVTSDAQVASLLAGFDSLDVLVNCAGIIMRGAEYEIETFKKVVDVNLTGTMRMCVAAKPLLVKSKNAAIVNTASILSFFGGPLVPAYAASKGGISQLTKSLAIAWAAEGIRVNAIAPGWISTELTRATHWLTRKHAITVLPAVSSLKALRRVAKASTATRPMLGIGNPLLDGDPSKSWEVTWAKKAREKQACPKTPWQRITGLAEKRRSVTKVATRGGRADLDHLRSQVPLHDTADELSAAD